MKSKTTRYIIAVTVLSLAVLLSGERIYPPKFVNIRIEADTLNAAIGIDRGMFASKGFPIGFQYKLLQSFTAQEKISVNILSPFSDYNNWELLHDGDIDILVVDMAKDSIPGIYADSFNRSIFITDSSAWIVRKEDEALLNDINIWLAYYMQKSDFDKLKYQFFRSYRLQSHLENMTQTNVISPYDDIIKAGSRIVGWDWRLLAALIYQESRFSMGAMSSKGAVGLMQIKESTARHYGISDVFNPMNNVRAGSVHLRYLRRLFEAEGMDSTNVVKFSLAAYNAGEGRMNECMNFTLSQGKDYRDWEEVCRTIPLMSSFKGTETIHYVDDVLSKYEEYLFVIKP